MLVTNYDKDCIDPSVAATVGTLGLGIAVLTLAKKYKIAQGIANANVDQVTIPDDPDIKTALMLMAIKKQMNEWKECIWNSDKFTAEFTDEMIEDWARKNRFTRFSYNRFSAEVYRIIVCITAYMILIAKLDDNIIDYVRGGGGYCSALALAYDLYTWYILEATVSDNSPFFKEDDKLCDSDVAYLERAIKELDGFKNALQEDLKQVKDGTKSPVITYLEGNRFIVVMPLFQVKKASIADNVYEFIHVEDSKQELKHIAEIPNCLEDNFAKRLRQNIVEPCMLAKQHKRRMSDLQTAEEIKSFLQLAKQVGEAVTSL